MTLLTNFRLQRAFGFALVPSLVLMALQLIAQPPADPAWFLVWILAGQLAWILFALALLAEYFIFQGPFRRLPFGIILLLRTLVYSAVTIALNSLLGQLLVMLGFSLPPSLSPGNLLLFVSIACATLGLWTFISMLGGLMGRGTLPALMLGAYRRGRQGRAGVMVIEPADTPVLRERLSDLVWLGLMGDFLALVNLAAQASGGRVRAIHEHGATIEWKSSQVKTNGPLLFHHELARLMKKNTAWFMGHYAVEPGFRAGLHFAELSHREIGAGKRDIITSGVALRGAQRLLEASRKTREILLVSGAYADYANATEALAWRRVGLIPAHGTDPEILALAPV